FVLVLCRHSPWIFVSSYLRGSGTGFHSGTRLPVRERAVRPAVCVRRPRAIERDDFGQRVVRRSAKASAERRARGDPHRYRCVHEPSGRLYTFVGRVRSNETTPVSALYTCAKASAERR